MPDVQQISDWRGKQIRDRDGGKIGKLEDVYVDTETDEPVFGTVKEGLISKHLTFLPLGDAAASPDGLQVPVSGKQVKDALNLDQGAELSARDERDLYRHFDLPYTAPGGSSGRRLARR